MHTFVQLDDCEDVACPSWQGVLQWDAIDSETVKMSFTGHLVPLQAIRQALGAVLSRVEHPFRAVVAALQSDLIVLKSFPERL